MKRMLSLILAVLLLLSILPEALAADEPNPIPVIAKEDITPTPPGIHHYMLICVDSWAADLTKSGNHTDGLMLVTVDEYAQRVMLTSFIRDMLIQRPDGKFGRINDIMDLMSPKTKNGIDGKQGIQMLIDTINSHFDLRIEQFIVVDFKQVENIIDAIDGVDISLLPREKARIESFGVSLPPPNNDGTYHLQGYTAVLYMRIRKVATVAYLHSDGGVYSDTQDYGRTYRDRIVLSTIADKLKEISYQDALRLLDVILANTVYTNMTMDDLLNALDLAMEMRGVPVEHIRMPISNPSKQKDDGTWYEVSPTIENFNKGGYSYCEFPLAQMATKEVNYEMNREALHSFLLDSFVVVDDE